MSQGKQMRTENCQIFRADAVRQYIQQQQKAELPRFLCRRTFIYLWILLALLLIAGGVVIALFRGSLFTAGGRTGPVVLAQSQQLESRARLHFRDEEECR